MYGKILNLTKKLVSIPSLNATGGEKAIGEFLYNYISGIPYFKKHPDQVFTVPLKEDSLGRMNVFALLLGEKCENDRPAVCNENKFDNKDTIILHGHTDTVGIEDFGDLKEYACDCDKLAEKLKEIQNRLGEEVREDLLSGDYLFGRGASDMKSGVAVHLAVLEEISTNPEQLRGNILLTLNPVEESLHTGFIESLDTLLSLKEAFDLHYLFAINNDFICGMYPGDETRYVYTGSVGKLLPCFYIKGKETHVGQAFEGVDACRIGAEIVRLINLNCDYCDGYKGEYPAPPAVLRMKDLKPYYNVQTSISSFVYFNYMVHNKTVSEVLTGLKEAAGQAVHNVLGEMNERYLKYCRLTQIEYRELNPVIEVKEYRDIYEIAKAAYDGDLDALVNEIAVKSVNEGDDKRETSLKIVERLFTISGIKNPTVVLFFATPHCPHNTLKDEIPEEKKLTEEIAALLEKFGKANGETFKLMHFFPSLTDSSYLKIDDDPASIDILKDNFPKQDLLYPVPYEKIRTLNIPGLNYGSFGKDAHKWTERVKMSYSFDKLPRLIMKTVEKYLM